MSDLRSKIVRLAHARPDLRPHLLPLVSERVAGRGIPFHDLPAADDLRDGFRRLTRVWSSQSEATGALLVLLDRHGLERTWIIPGSPQQWSLRTVDGEPVVEKLNLFYRPGPRPGWVAFQVST